MLGERFASAGRGVVETTFVLFFLSLDFGQNLTRGTADSVFLGATIIVVATLPYFLPTAGESRFMEWLTGRSAIVLFGLVIGLMYRQVVGVLLPEIFTFVPIAMAMIAGIFSCYLMFSNYLRLGFVK